MLEHDFLVEIFTEELPPKSLRSLAEHFCDGIKSRLEKAELPFANIKYFATPRRLAVLVNKLAEHQTDKVMERKGPALNNAYDANGNPTQACVGFARSCGIDVSELITLDTPQGKFVGCKQQVQGKKVNELMPAIVTEAVNALPVTKPMRWGNYTQKFIRPIHSVIMLYGNKVIDADILGYKTGNETEGHRFLHSGKVKVSSPDQYESILEKAFVLVDFNKRQEKIKKQITDAKNTIPHVSNISTESEKLLEEVTSIVEWPHTFIGSFDKEFLKVPAEALISAMQDHQRYFPVFRGLNELLPNFIAVSNIDSKDIQRVIKGNERVLRARLADAAFFFDTDRKTKLEDRVEALKPIVFQNKLGTLFDKTERIKKLAMFIANNPLTERAALLAKTDLTTNLVGEFPELQGIAGFYYAQHDGENQAVSSALQEQYWPRFSGDLVAHTEIGQALAIADRIDTLVGVFGINQAPTGDKDPFGLRRAALGVLRTIIENNNNLDLHDLIQHAAENYSGKLENKNVVNDTLTFMLDRLKPWFQEQNISTQVIASVMSLNLTKPYDIAMRIQAVNNFKKMSEAEALSAANKRVSNILAKYDADIAAHEIKDNLFESDAERDLAIKLDEQAKMISQLSQSAEYEKVLSQLSSLRIPVDNFFDHVMVMTDDKARRENRILMLKKLRQLFLNVADIALLQ